MYIYSSKNLMMKNTALSLLLIAMFVITGCPLQTKNSIDFGSYEVPAWLPGTWKKVIAKGELAKTGYNLQKQDAKGYLICYDVDSAGNVSSEGKETILSNVGGKVFIGVYEKGDDASEPGYYIFELRRVSDREMILAGVKEHKVDYDASSAELKKFLEENKNNPSLFDDAETTRYKKM